MSFTLDYVAYTIISSSVVSVTAFIGPPLNWNLTIPSSVTNSGTTYTVTSIGNGAFLNCTNLISVIIPDNVTTMASADHTLCSRS
jgi:hypothetical protein